MSPLIVQSASVVVATIVFALLYHPFHVAPLVFLALTPVTLVFANPMMRCSIPRAGLWGFAFGWLASLAIVGPWMFGAATEYFGRGIVWSLGFTLVVNAAYVGAFYAPAFVAIRLLAFVPPVLRVVGIASVWTTVEVLRASDPFGNVWATLGQAFAGMPVLREAAAYGGEAFLGWSAAICGAAIGVGVQPDADTQSASNCMKLAFLSLLVLAGLGLAEQERDQQIAPHPPLRVAVVQAEIPGRDVWDPARRVEHWNAYMDATRGLEPGTVDLIVWPESAVPFLLDSDASARSRLSGLASSLRAAILLGAPRSESAGEGRAAVYNSAWFFPPDAAEPLTYDKQRLLPYVEHSPAAPSEFADTGDYQAGKRPAWFDVKGWMVSPLVCFEAVYPGYAREAVLGGADLLVNLSNDAWFSGGAGPEQHYAMSSLRTVELRRPMVRAANGGVSGAIAPDGSDIGIPIQRRKAVGLYEIPSPPSRMTLAATAPGLVPSLAALLAALTVLFGLQQSWRHQTPP